ncbi:MAG: metallophosphoesterase [Candidatus Dojkabacteria bacterium]
MRIIHTADWQLTRNNRLQDFKNSVNQIADAAKEYQSCVCIAGDVFDNSLPDKEAETVFAEFIANVYPLSVFVLMGNHDYARKVSALTPYKALEKENLIVLDDVRTIKVDINGEILNLLSIPHKWKRTTPEVIDELSAAIKTFSMNKQNGEYYMILGHFTLGGLDYGFPVDVDTEFIVPREILCEKDIDYIGLGHIHKYIHTGNIVYPGSIEMNNWGEIDNEPSFVLIDNDKVERVKLNVRPKYTGVLSQAIHDIDKIKDGSLVRVGITAQEGESFSIFKNDLTKKGCDVIVYARDTQQSVSIETDIESFQGKGRDDYISDRVEKAPSCYDIPYLKTLIQNIKVEIT